MPLESMDLWNSPDLTQNKARMVLLKAEGEENRLVVAAWGWSICSPRIAVLSRGADYRSSFRGYFGQQPGYRNSDIHTPKQMRLCFFYLEKSGPSSLPSISRTISLFGSIHSSVLCKQGQTLLDALKRIQLKTLLWPLFI